MKSWWVVACLVIAIVWIVPTTGTAQKLAGGGARLQNDVPFLLLFLTIDHIEVELGWANTAQKLSQLGTNLSISTIIYAPLIKFHFPLNLDVTPYVGIGGYSFVMELKGSFEATQISEFIPENGLQAVAGVAYAPEAYPVNVFASLGYSTLEPISLVFDIDGKLESLSVPVKGISGFTWTVGFRYDFFRFDEI